MEKMFKVEFILSGDLAELYDAALKNKPDGVSPQQMNRSLTAAGILQHLSALLAQGYFNDPEAARLKGIMNRLLGKAFSSGVIHPFQTRTPGSDTLEQRRDSLLKSLERFERLIKTRNLPPEVVINEVKILKGKMDKFVYGLGA